MDTTQAPRADRADRPGEGTLAGHSDEDLMELWVRSRQGGRPAAGAFQLLWDRHRQATHAAALRILRAHPALAEEVVQEAWLEVARADHYRRGSFRSFIRTIVQRKALDLLQHGSVRLRTPGGDGRAADRALAAGASDAIDPGRLTEARQAMAVILELLTGLPRAQHLAWTLRYLRQLTSEEAAGVLGAPVGSVKTRVRLANAYLALAMRSRGLTPSDLYEAG